MKQWLTIVGMGEDGEESLAASARHALQNAEVIVGSKRLLAKLSDHKAERLEWPQPFSAAIDRIKPLQGRSTVILATGDPLNYGVARKLLEFIPAAEMLIIPHLSAFSLAAARMAWSLPDCDTLTLHGRDIANIEAFIQPECRLIVLTADGASVRLICNRLVARGFGSSDITVLENMGGASERVTSFTATVCPATDFSPLNTLAIHCKASAGANILARIPGLPDDSFQHDGQLTKREVRAASLAALAPAPDQLLWDVGAGCGSIAIEWMRASRGCEAIAFEQNEQRLAMIAANADRLGAPRLRIVAGEVPTTYEGQPEPDAVFIGGGIAIPGTFEKAWDRLKPGGRMVANVVSIEGEMHLYDLQEKHGGELVRLDISMLHRIGPLRSMKPRMPVTQWRCVKP